MSESTADVRNDWWQVIAITPLVLPIGGFIGGTVGGLLIIAFGLAYPLALRRDTKYVNSTTSTWEPNPLTYTMIGLVVFPLTLGILSYLVSPVYLYRRHKHTG